MSTSAKASDSFESCSFDSEDFRFFDGAIEQMVQEIRGAAQLSAPAKAHLRERLAVALFQCAKTGHHDYQRLRGQVLKTMFSTPESA